MVYNVRRQGSFYRALGVNPVKVVSPKKPTKPKRQLTEAAQVAKLIRQDLKKTFPGTKFRVKSSNFSMGDSVDVYWEDGVPDELVKKRIKKYQYGHFDGMQDLYEYSNTRDDIPQAKYVHTQRTMSEGARKYLVNKYNKNWQYPIKDWNTEGWEKRNQIFRDFNKTDFQEHSIKRAIIRLLDKDS